MRIAFYTTVKHPDHPIPSGERTIARDVRDMLTALGHEVEVVSHLRAYQSKSKAEIRVRQLTLAHLIAMTLIRRYQRRGAKPDLWFSYNVYYKAPDLIGPWVATGLDIPYVALQNFKLPKEIRGPFRNELSLMRATLRQCSAICYHIPKFKKLAKRMVTCPIFYLPPSVIPEQFERAQPLDQRWRDKSHPIIASLSMFRQGRKADSLKFLAQSLVILHERAPSSPWIAVIGGDGPAREEVQAAFDALPPGRIRWLGMVPPEDVPRFMKSCDIFTFPGLREPLGMVYLEAQAAGRPVVAVKSSGIASAVSPQGAILVDQPDPSAYADALMQLLEDPERRRQMGAAASDFVKTERSRAVAQARLAEGLTAAIEYHKGHR